MYMVWWWATPLYCQFLIFLYIQYTVKLCDHSISCDALEVELNNFKLNSGPLWCLLTCHCDNKYGGFESINLLNCYNTFSRLQVFQNRNISYNFCSYDTLIISVPFSNCKCISNSIIPYMFPLFGIPFRLILDPCPLSFNLITHLMQ